MQKESYRAGGNASKRDVNQVPTAKFSRCETVEGAEAADGGLARIVDVEKILEGKLFQASSGEPCEFGARERPGHLSFGVGRLAASGDDELETTWAEEAGKIFDRAGTEVSWKHLESVGLKDKIESATPDGWRCEQVRSQIFDSRVGEAFARSTDGGFRDVKGRSAEPPGGELLGIVAEAAADGQSSFSGSWLRMRFPKIEQERIGAEIGPGNNALPCFAFLVKRLEPAGRVTLTNEFSG